MSVGLSDVGQFALSVVAMALCVLVLRLPRARQALGISRLAALIARLSWRWFGRDQRREER